MTIQHVRNLRRLSQTAFFGIFCWLILKTNFEAGFNPGHLTEIMLPYPVSIGLEFDPLTALATLLGNGTLHQGLLWSLLILIPTIFLGRFFCGWVCPLGTVNHWISEIPSERVKRRSAAKINSNRYKRYQRWKYYIFFFFMAAALGGSLQVSLLDPLPLMARSIGTVILPTLQTGVVGLVGWSKTLGLPVIGKAADFVYDLVAAPMLNFRIVHFHAIFTIGLLFFLILAANRIFTRFWCRGICPLGAMLGLFSRFAIFGLQKREGDCTKCDKCLLHCQGADNPQIGQPWRQAECHLCLNCQTICPEGSLRFQFFPDHGDGEKSTVPISKIDVSRRKTLAALIGGLAAVPLFRTGDTFEVNSNPRLIRPPGSIVESQFLASCIRCGQCMRVCPNNALHPTLSEAGIEGLWTPIMIPRIGYCEPTCTLCTQVCPTGAIKKMNIKDKVGDKETQPNRIGTAFFDRGRCLPWAMAIPCIVCEEWCPTSPKSIYLKDVIVINSKGEEVAVKQPYIDPSHCTGCGACEFTCPVRGKPAVYVLSVGESRSPNNQILLQRLGHKKGITQ